MYFFQKIAIIERMIGTDAPLASQLRAYILLGKERPQDVNAATTLALKAIQMDAYGLGWNTKLTQNVDGPDSPAIEISVGEVIDRFEIAYFLKDTEDNGRQMSDEWTSLIHTTK